MTQSTEPLHSLRGRTVVVFGATGHVGFGTASAMIRAGARVILPSRRAFALATTIEALPRGIVVPVEGDVSDAAGSDKLRDGIVALGPIDHVVASLGSWWMGGRFVDQTAEELERVRRMLFDAQAHAARTLLPRLAVDGSYTIVTGEGAHGVQPGLSLLTIATAGTIALSRVLRLEHDRGPRVNELLIQTRVERAARPGAELAEDVGAAIAQVVTSTVRSAIIPFRSLSTFRLETRAPER